MANNNNYKGQQQGQQQQHHSGNDIGVIEAALKNQFQVKKVKSKKAKQKVKAQQQQHHSDSDKMKYNDGNNGNNKYNIQGHKFASPSQRNCNMAPPPQPYGRDTNDANISQGLWTNDANINQLEKYTIVPCIMGIISDYKPSRKIYNISQQKWEIHGAHGNAIQMRVANDNDDCND